MRAALLAGTAIAGSTLGFSQAVAQTAQELPPINVEATRLIAKPVASTAGGRIPVVSAGAPAATADVVNSGIASFGITGAATDVISREQIARSPAQSIQDIIAQIPGAQVRKLFGNVDGAKQSVDLRGFGATGTSNTLILINGRRLNDLDIQGVDLAAIPRDSIERIEVTRGNSGAVLYGDNAVGGVINIVTRTGVGVPNRARIEGGFGSFNRREGNASATVSSGPWSAAMFGNIVDTDGYRANNKYRQGNGSGDIRYTTPDFSAFATISGDEQHLGLPGARSTREFGTNINQLATNPRGAATPFDFANQQGLNGTAGFTKTLWDGGQLIVDGGVRQKQQQASFFFGTVFPPTPGNYVDTNLTTYSITPRLSITNPVFGLPSRIQTGIDYYDANYHSERPQARGGIPVHVYDLRQDSLAAYWQQTVGLLPTTDVSYGGRIQRIGLDARDRFNPLAPGAFFDSGHDPLKTSQTQHALHVGLEHRFTNQFAVFGRAARAFRTPNVDERVASGPAFDFINFVPIQQSFGLRTQTSEDAEVGFRIRAGAFDMQSSVYGMNLKNELQFDPVNFVNRNLDPTRRYGWETSASLRLSETVALRSGIALTRAVFREGEFRGNDVPLVSPVTATGGVSWNIWERYLVLDVTARMWGQRRFDNDQANRQVLIPANATADLKLSGEYQRLFWSFTVNNIFDVKYYDYGIARVVNTPTDVGVFNAYPLPGRTFLLKAGFTL